MCHSGLYTDLCNMSVNRLSNNCIVLYYTVFQIPNCTRCLVRAKPSSRSPEATHSNTLRIMLDADLFVSRLDAHFSTNSSNACTAATHVHTSTRCCHTNVLLLFWNMSGTIWVSRYQKGKTSQVKTNLDLLEQEIVCDSGICWAICKSAPHPRQITMPTSHHSVFTGRMPFLPPNQQCQSTEGKNISQV